jgi:hypothetical protein
MPLATTPNCSTTWPASCSLTSATPQLKPRLSTERKRQVEVARLAKLEKRAKIHVDYAKKLIAEGNTDAEKLRERLDKIIKDFAGTPSAEEAARLRKDLDKPKEQKPPEKPEP